MNLSKGLNIVFFGTPDFAAGVLQEILKSPHQVAGVVTTPDKPAGRGRKLRPSAVKQLALENNLPVLQPANLKDPVFLKNLRALNADVFVVVAFRILPRVVWEMPPKGTFNLHASLLPDYRGAAPINWAIINGEKQTGVTTFFIDDRIDTGEIIAQTPVDIAPDETAGTLHDKLMHAGARLTLQTLDRLAAGKVETRKQSHIPTPHPAPKLNKDNTRIHWNRPVTEIERLIRGLAPYPGAWTQVLRNGTSEKWYIYSAGIEQNKPDLPPGTAVLDGKKLKIAASDGWILPQTLKPQAKKTMPVKDFLNGIRYRLDDLKFL